MNIFNSRYRLNRILLRIHKALIMLFLFGALASATVKSLISRDILIGLTWLLYSLLVYLLLALLVLIIHTLIAYPFRNRLYYQIWLARVVPKLQKIHKKEKGRFLKLMAGKLLGNISSNTLRIMKSTAESRLVNGYIKNDSLVWKKAHHLPVFVRREDLMAKRFWPDWAYAIVMLFNEIKITKERLGKKQVFRLHVDLRNQSYGIYNNSGKSFLRHEWGSTSMFRTKCSDRSKRIKDFFDNPKKLEHKINCKSLPLRWASGGFLPVIKWRKKRWIALFFRDLNPIGWNVANGASENKEEYKDIDHLIIREFGEELLILDNTPIEDCRYIPFDFPDAGKNKLMKKFTKQHLELRTLHDGIYIEKTSEYQTKIRILDTPFRLFIEYHLPSFKTSHYEIPNILFQINPTEFGIEILRICEFEIPDDSYLLDGEIWISNNQPVLVRRPVIMFSIEYLERVFKHNNKSLGSINEEAEHLDCKRINDVAGPGDFHLFDADIILRKRRLNNLKKESNKLRMPETNRCEAWLDRFGKQFQEAQSKKSLNPSENSDLLSLCPVTWKAIEQIFKYRII